MSSWLTILVSAVGGVIALAVAVALIKSGKPIRGLVGSGAQGICALAAVNIAGAFTGVSLGLNLLTMLSCVVLGIPGVVTMLILKLIFNL